MTGKRRRYRAVVRLRTNLAGSFLRIPSTPGDSAVPLSTNSFHQPYTVEVEHHTRRGGGGRYVRAIKTPGIFLSHPGTTTIPSNQ